MNSKPTDIKFHSQKTAEVGKSNSYLSLQKHTFFLWHHSSRIRLCGCLTGVNLA